MEINQTSFNSLTEKQEWRDAQAKKKAKRNRVLRFVCAYTFVCIAATIAITLLFCEKPYTVKEVALNFLGAVIGAIIGHLLGALSCYISDQRKLNKRKAVLPLLLEELQKLNIQTPEQYADWINEYLEPCLSKKISQEQLTVLEESHIYYLKNRDVYTFNCKIGTKYW